MPVVKYFIETDRLILREFQLTDLDGFYELDSDPEVHRYLGNNPVQNKDFLIQVIKAVQQQYIDNGIGRWSIIEKSSGEFVGWAGLKFIRDTINNHTNFYDVGYRLKRKFWGKGLATESTRICLDYAFHQLNCSEVFGITHVDNYASQKVLLKYGLKFVENFVDDGMECKWYRIDKF